jgi:D-alanyl-D-alanine carboxypeptidase
MLLGHTSGIPEWVTAEVHARVLGDPGHIWTPEEAIEIASRQPPWFAPGTSWRYSTDYTLLGLVYLS